jgi:hypothetical protein
MGGRKMFDHQTHIFAHIAVVGTVLVCGTLFAAPLLFALVGVLSL